MNYAPRRELAALTGLRYGAAIWVVLFHFAPIHGASVARPLRDSIGMGYLAVSLFFVLSGFVLSYSYLDAVGSMRADVRSFWIARVARICPTYVLSFILCVPLYIAAKTGTGSPLSVTTRVFGVSALYLTFTQAWTPWTPFILNFPAWSLSDEAFFYFCFPSARQIVRFRGNALAMAICVCFMLAVAPAALLLCTGPMSQENADILQRFAGTFPLFRIAQFVLGMLLAKLYRERPSDARYATLLVTASIILGLMTVTNASRLPTAVVETVALAVFAALIYGLAYGQGKVAAILSHRLTVLLGNASYAVYIFQRPVASYLGVTNAGSWLTLTAYIVVLTAVSIGSLFWIERPLQKLILHRCGTTRSPKHSLVAMAQT